MQEPKMSTDAEEFFVETLRVAAQAASAHEKAKLRVLESH